MFGKQIRLFTLLGFTVQIDVSWFLLAVLVTWSLAVGAFPAMFAGLAQRTYWSMGVVGALGLFTSILLHEFSHSLVARAYDLPIHGITLFLFGGVSHMDEEPQSPKVEFLMAVAGPIMSVVVAGVCLGSMALLGGDAWPVPVKGVVGFLGTINLILAAFNLLPAYPLDGGRMLRSLLWHWQGSLRKATRISAKIGETFGLVLIVLGFLGIFSQNFVGGLWWILIGFFLRSAAQMSYQQLLIRKALEGEPVRRFMSKDPVTVPPDVTLSDFVEDYVYEHHFKMFPVTQNGKTRGCVSTREVKEIPKAEWSSKTVSEVATACTSENTVAPEEDSVQVLRKMQRNSVSRLLVVESDKLVGVIALKDLLRFISLKLDLENEDEIEAPSL